MVRLNSLLNILGGVGLFLLGRALMTSGLRKMAGDRLRLWLAKSTRNPYLGAVTGAAATTLVQSSGATTLAAVGFVGAGLMTFQESLGVIFGANIGSTTTGWMVALVGFKFNLATVALPLLFGASLLYLLQPTPGLRGMGKAVSGFCLIFIGITYLQEGLEGYREVIRFEQGFGSRAGGRVLLVLLGALLTVIMQSSGATVAMTVTALNTAVIDLPQAGAMIIGADIGTTATAALATIGGSTASRRTGFAHVIFNLMTGVAAFILLPVYLWCWEKAAPGAVADSPELVAVSFHSAFNVLGVLAVLPFTARFARMIERMFPEATPALTAAFDVRLQEDPYVALAGLEAGTRKLAVAALRHAAGLMKGGGRRAAMPGGEEIGIAVELGREFAVGLGGRGIDEDGPDGDRVFACVHLLDHIERLVERAQDWNQRRTIPGNGELAGQREEAVRRLEALAREMEAGRSGDEEAGALEKLSQQMEQDKAGFRAKEIGRGVQGKVSGEELNRTLDAHRCLRRIVYHAWRMAHYWGELSAGKG